VEFSLKDKHQVGDLSPKGQPVFPFPSVNKGKSAIADAMFQRNIAYLFCFFGVSHKNSTEILQKFNIFSKIVCFVVSYPQKTICENLRNLWTIFSMCFTYSAVNKNRQLRLLLLMNVILFQPTNSCYDKYCCRN
jgi:hypothetical protein